MLRLTTPVFYVSRVVHFSETNGRVFSGISNDQKRLANWVNSQVEKEVEKGFNNPEAGELEIEQL